MGLFTEDMDTERELSIERALRSALALGEGFEVVYQPIYDADGAKFSLAEALLRLRDPLLGNVPPSEFIPVAERTGLICEIGYFVVETACAFIKRQENSFGSVSVNASAVQFLKPDFADRVLEIAERHKINESQLMIELTESMSCERRSVIESNMLKLKSGGICVALDDFGTGYADIQTMLLLPISAIKIDKEYVQRINENCAQLLIRSLVGLARSMGLQVIAEGVETHEQRRLLWECGCDMLQGYLFSRPICAADCERLNTRQSESGVRAITF